MNEFYKIVRYDYAFNLGKIDVFLQNTSLGYDEEKLICVNKI